MVYEKEHELCNRLMICWCCSSVSVWHRWQALSRNCHVVMRHWIWKCSIMWMFFGVFSRFLCLFVWLNYINGFSLLFSLFIHYCSFSTLSLFYVILPPFPLLRLRFNMDKKLTCSTSLTSIAYQRRPPTHQSITFIIVILTIVIITAVIIMIITVTIIIFPTH